MDVFEALHRLKGCCWLVATVLKHEIRNAPLTTLAVALAVSMLAWRVVRRGDCLGGSTRGLRRILRLR